MLVSLRSGVNLHTFNEILALNVTCYILTDKGDFAQFVINCFISAVI